MRLRGFGRARLPVVVALVALGGAAMLGVATVGSAGNSNKLVVDLRADPGPVEVTYGGNVAFTLDISNPSNNPWNKVLVTIPAPATGPNSEAILKYKVCPDGTILSGTSDDIVCDLGTLAPGATPRLFFVYEMPAEGSDCAPTQSDCIETKVTVTGKEGTSAPDSPKSKGREDVFEDTVSTILLDTFDTDKREAATYALTSCTDVSTPTLETNDGLSLGNPLQTQVCVPSLPVGDPFNPGQVVAANERDHGPLDPGRTQVADICIPTIGELCDGDHTPEVFLDELGDPALTITFVLNNKLYSGPIDEVYEDGVLLSFNTDADPYIDSITVDHQAKTTTIVVKSSDNGGWGFG